ncbi:endonuclease/exonuclease/phosphatase family protein [Candidatus Daviesbacteria bacterium]|nr:endonuclease/exonuclease/phosphatase family protein [Candidatus Daviesbacteria bacterium]
MKLKVLSWNIWKGQHLDKIIEVLEKESADIIGLQEIKVQDGTNIAEIIAEKLGYDFVYCKAYTTDRHTPPYDLGNAVLSKFSITENECILLSTLEDYKKEEAAMTEPRGACIAKININGGEITFISTHLAFSLECKPVAIREIQLNTLLKVIDKKNTVLMGDFNSVPESDVVRKLSEKLINTDPEMKELSWINYRDPNKTKYRIDYIFTTPDLKAENFQIVETDASDHYPLLIDLEVCTQNN